jgi:hypothetical protein
MNRLVWTLCLAASLAGCTGRKPRDGSATATTPGPVFFVATNGNDQWSGTRPSVGRSKTDGPFATPQRALQAVRELRLRAGANPGRPATVFLHGGDYFLPEPLVLKPEDCGLTVAAYGQGKPVLSGGRPIGGWKEVSVSGKQLWAAEVPEVRAGKWYFRELWVNDQRAIRARHPNQGYFSVVDPLDPVSDWMHGHNRFHFREGDLRAWPTATEAEVVVMDRWVESRLPVFSVDEREHLISFNKRSVFQLGPGDLYYLEGAFEALDAPGEWYLDRHSGKLYYLHRPGETLAAMKAVAPALAQAIRFEGQPASGQCVERVVLRGLTIAHTEWALPDDAEGDQAKAEYWPGPRPGVGGFGQAAVGVPGAVWGQGLRDCSFEACSFSHLGNYGLELGRGCQGNRILNCEFSDLGAGGIKLGEVTIRERAADQTRGNEISGCHIHDGGKLFQSAIGIWLGQTPDNRITHNLIHDFYYTGISIGWSWGYGAALATNNLVAFNHVHHLGMKADGDGPVLSDMGGIYTLGKQPGTRILNNLWHDIAGLRYGGWGIYFDEGSSGILAASNVVYRTTHGGFHQHYGETNVVRNNIFAFARDHQIQRTRAESHVSFLFQTNIVYFDSGVLLGGDWSGDRYQLDWNVYFDARREAGPEAMRFAGVPLEQWRARGHDLHSLIADPRFVAPERDDFRLQSDSPALRLGFQQIDLSHVGK